MGRLPRTSPTNTFRLPRNQGWRGQLLAEEKARNRHLPHGEQSKESAPLCRGRTSRSGFFPQTHRAEFRRLSARTFRAENIPRAPAVSPAAPELSSSPREFARKPRYISCL